MKSIALSLPSGGAKKAANETIGRERPRRPAKLSFNEVRELESIPARLQAVEAEQKALVERLADPALYQDRAADPKALNARHAENAAQLDRLLARWEELERRT